MAQPLFVIKFRVSFAIQNREVTIAIGVRGFSPIEMRIEGALIDWRALSFE